MHVMQVGGTVRQLEAELKHCDCEAILKATRGSKSRPETERDNMRQREAARGSTRQHEAARGISRGRRETAPVTWLFDDIGV